MPENRFRQLALYAAVLLAVAFLGWRWTDAGEATPPPARPGMAKLSIEDSGGGRLTVHVAGAVRRPGVYRLPAGARVDDAVVKAGGPTRAADLTQVNLAAQLEDGRQVLLPERPPVAGAGPAAASPAAAAGAAALTPGVPLNLNTATLEQLDALDGIGPATAQKILDYRQANNGFGSVDELGEVPGIGDKRLATLRELVRV